MGLPSTSTSFWNRDPAAFGGDGGIDAVDVQGGTTIADEVHDADISARFVRYLGHGSTATTFNSVSELSVFAVP